MKLSKTHMKRIIREEFIKEAQWGNFTGGAAPLDTYSDQQGEMPYEEQLKVFELMMDGGKHDPKELLNHPENIQNGLSFPDLQEDDVEDILSKLGLPEMNDPKWQRHIVGRSAVQENFRKKNLKRIIREELTREGGLGQFRPMQGTTHPQKTSPEAGTGVHAGGHGVNISAMTQNKPTIEEWAGELLIKLMPTLPQLQDMPDKHYDKTVQRITDNAYQAVADSLMSFAPPRKLSEGTPPGNYVIFLNALQDSVYNIISKKLKLVPRELDLLRGQLSGEQPGKDMAEAVRLGAQMAYDELNKSK